MCLSLLLSLHCLLFFFFNDTATTEIYTLSLHDALPISKQLSLGHAAYFGLGAYTSTILQIDFGISPWIGMIAGGGVAMLASPPIGWRCFCLRGPYFPLATLPPPQPLILIFLHFPHFPRP